MVTIFLCQSGAEYTIRGWNQGIVTIFFCHQRKSAYDVRDTQGGHEVTVAGAESCLGLKEYDHDFNGIEWADYD